MHLVKSKKRPKNDNPLEDEEQIKVIVYLKKRGILHFSVPNSGNRSLAYACKMKRLGLSAGVPDIVIPEPMGFWHGMFIEMKRKTGGVVSEAQQA